MLLAVPAAAIITAYPLMSWLVNNPAYGNLLIVELWLSLIFGTYNGAMIPFLAEIMPPLVRTASFSLAFSCATAIFGGMTPAVCTYLIHATENRAMPGAWLTVPALLALVSALLTRPYVRRCRRGLPALRPNLSSKSGLRRPRFAALRAA
jgi:hypothetical protein